MKETRSQPKYFTFERPVIGRMEEPTAAHRNIHWRTIVTKEEDDALIDKSFVIDFCVNAKDQPHYPTQEKETGSNQTELSLALSNLGCQPDLIEYIQAAVETWEIVSLATCRCQEEKLIALVKHYPESTSPEIPFEAVLVLVNV